MAEVEAIHMLEVVIAALGWLCAAATLFGAGVVIWALTTSRITTTTLFERDSAPDRAELIGASAPVSSLRPARTDRSATGS